MTDPRSAAPGDLHGKLVILSIGEPGHKYVRHYEAQCDCGVVTQVRSDNWGRTVSCGCARSTQRHARALEIEGRAGRLATLARRNPSPSVGSAA